MKLTIENTEAKTLYNILEEVEVGLGAKISNLTSRGGKIIIASPITDPTLEGTEICDIVEDINLNTPAFTLEAGDEIEITTNSTEDISIVGRAGSEIILSF